MKLMSCKEMLSFLNNIKASKRWEYVSDDEATTLVIEGYCYVKKDYLCFTQKAQDLISEKDIK